jgi:hypothetical protein
MIYGALLLAGLGLATTGWPWLGVLGGALFGGSLAKALELQFETRSRSLGWKRLGEKAAIGALYIGLGTYGLFDLARNGQRDWSDGEIGAMESAFVTVIGFGLFFIVEEAVGLVTRRVLSKQD